MKDIKGSCPGLYWIISGDLGGWDFLHFSRTSVDGGDDLRQWFRRIRLASEAKAPAAEPGCHRVSKAVFNNQRVPSGKLT